MASSPAPPAPFERIVTLLELRRAPRQRVQHRFASGRGVMVLLLVRPGAWPVLEPGPLHADETVVVMDVACYHHGGPLVDGEVEELPGGRCAILCPWHKYMLELHGPTAGAGLYVGLDIATRTKELRSKGVKQRVHPAIVAEEGGQHVVHAADSAVLTEEQAAAAGESALALWRAMREAAAAEPALGGTKLASDAYATQAFKSLYFSPPPGAAGGGSEAEGASSCPGAFAAGGAGLASGFAGGGAGVAPPPSAFPIHSSRPGGHVSLQYG